MSNIFQIFRNDKCFPKYFSDRKFNFLLSLVFEIKGANQNKVSKFLNGCLSVTGNPVDMTFGVFLETYLRLPKSIISQFFPKYSKNYNNLNVKNA